MKGGGRAKYLLPCRCIRDSNYFNIKLDPVLKKMNYDRLTLTPKSTQEGETQALDRKSRLICFIFIVTLSACKISVKHRQLSELLRNVIIRPY